VLDTVSKRRAEIAESQEELTALGMSESEAYRETERELKRLTATYNEAEILRDEAISNVEAITAMMSEQRALAKFAESGEAAGGAIAKGVGDALKAWANNDFNGVNLKSVIHSTFTQIRDAMLDTFTKDLSKNLSNALKAGFKEAFGFAGKLAGDLANATLMIISTIVASMSKEAEETHTQVKDMIESTEQVRGIISGDTTVKLQEVAVQLRDALRPTNDILRGILGAVRGGGIGEAAVGNASAI
jgi:uncharacterized protein YukE